MDAIARTYLCNYDFNRRLIPPSKEYMLATLPRSGSTFLSLELWRTGALGAPVEYTNEAFIGPLRQRLAVHSNKSQYWRGVKTLRTSPNGVFSYKMFMTNYLECADIDKELLQQFSADQVVYLTRKDRLAQAISHAKAIQTGVWYADAKSKIEPVYHYNQIKECLAMIDRQLDFWEKLFELTETPVHRIEYEDLLCNSSSVVTKVANFLEVEISPKSKINVPHLKVQRDSYSDDWTMRFLEEDDLHCR